MPELQALRTEQPPVVDGRLDDEAWKSVPATRAFIQKFPKERGLPSEPTSLQVLYDNDALYIAIDCTQREVPIVRRLTRRDRKVDADYVTVALDSRRDGTTAFEFTVSAAGVLVDGIRFNDTEFDDTWDENWDGRTAQTADGWSAELRIPLRILRFDRVPVQDWGMQVRRYTALRQETDEWAYIPRADAGEVSHYGRLRNLIALKPGRSLELRPFVVGRVQWFDISAPFREGATFGGSAGIDLKWHITQNMTLDATANPDFGQVEADQVVLNLTTYEVFYPEKRPFFLEGVDTFRTPLPLLYTRRIGRPPEVPILRSDLPFGEQTLADPTPATLYGAAKLIGNLGRRVTIGTLSALQAPNEVPVLLLNRDRNQRVASPLTLFNLLRMKVAVGSNAHIGLIATATNRFERPADYPIVPGSTGTPDLQLCPAGDLLAPGSACYHHGYVAGLDGRWRSPAGNYVLSGQAIVTGTVGGPPRTMLDGTVVQSGDVAPGGYLYFGKEGGEHWVGSIEAEFAGRTLDYNDLGYMRRQNLFRVSAQLEYRTLKPWRNTLETHTRLEFFDRENLSFLNLARGYQLNATWKLTNFWEFFVELHYRAAHFDDREVGDGTALEREGLVGFEVSVSSDKRRRVHGDLFVQNQVLFNGYNFALEGDITFRVLPQLDLQLLPQAVYTFGEPRYAGPGAQPGQYLFGRLLAKAVGGTLRATYTFTPRLTLQVYTQLLLGSKHYYDFSSLQSDPKGPRPAARLRDLQPTAVPVANPDFVEPVMNLSAVLRWEYLPGSTLYLVYTRSQAPLPSFLPGQEANLDLGAFRVGPASDALLIKFSYWFG